MLSAFPSIQSFYGSEVAEISAAITQKPRDTGDGFTKQEISAALRPLSGRWVPSREYRKLPIALLEAGACNCEITGRVVNFSTITARSGIQPSTEGQYLILLSDDSGVIAVRLSYNKPADFNLVLGSRLTIFTTYIAQAKKREPDDVPHIRYCTTICPSRSGATHIIFHQDLPLSNGDLECRVPPGLVGEEDESYPGLISLEYFLSGGFDMEKAMILVCVRFISPCYTVRSRKDTMTSIIEVGIFDDTATSILKLWGEHASSANSFVPNQTILLISYPTCKIIERQSKKRAEASAEIGIGHGSMLHINPTIAEAHWLREKIVDPSLENVLTRVPEDAWSTDLLMNKLTHNLFTIAKIDKNVRQDVARDIIGKLNITFLEVNLTSMRQKGMLCCTVCCCIALYANKPIATCKNCGCQKELSLNPQVLGAMVDESGTLMASQLAWKDSAWTQLFFGELEDTQYKVPENAPDLIEQSWEELTVLDSLSLKDIEEQMLYSRVSLTFCWKSRLRRLCVLGVEW